MEALVLCLELRNAFLKGGGIRHCARETLVERFVRNLWV
jgi:hypothetical protein